MTTKAEQKRASVERALEIHVPGRWRHDEHGYAVAVPGYGDTRLRSIAEAEAFAIGCALGQRSERADDRVLVLVGPGYPVRDGDPDGDDEVILFPSRAAAEQWISDHPKARTPVIERSKVAERIATPTDDDDDDAAGPIGGHCDHCDAEVAVVTTTQCAICGTEMDE